jgi:CRP/FNR family transcriptional regulator, cyclic AMP receptor protein
MAQVANRERERLEQLERLPLFRGLPLDTLGEILKAGQLQTFQAGEVILRQGDLGAEMYILLSGQVEIDRRLGGGGPRFLRLVLEPGEFFGEMGLLESKPRTATVIALDQTECLTLTRPQLEELLRAYPQLAIGLLTTLSRRLRALGA